MTTLSLFQNTRNNFCKNTFIILFIVTLIFSPSLAFSKENAASSVTFYLTDADTSYKIIPSDRDLSIALHIDGTGPSLAGSLLAAALEFSGINSSRQKEAANKAFEVISEAVGEANSARKLYREKYDKEYEAGKAVFDVLHNNLKTYKMTSADFDNVILNGVYNCGGSASYFAILALAAGLDVHAVMLDEHVYCYLMIDGKRINCETTNKNGYDIDVEKDVSKEEGTEVDLRTLISVTLWNKAVLCDNKKQWAEALRLSAIAYVYTSSGIAEVGSDNSNEKMWKSFQDRVFNCASDLSNKKKYKEALELVETTILTYGHTELLDDFHRKCMTNYIIDEIIKAPVEQKLELFETAKTYKIFDYKQELEIASHIGTSLINDYQSKNEWKNAWDTAIEYKNKYPYSKILSKAEENAKNNWVVSIHNQFVTLYNQGKYEEARTFINEALQIIPDNNVLIRDLEIVPMQ